MSSMIAGLYDMEDTLGSGHFAVVKSARHVFTGLRVAIKVIDKCKLDDVSKAHLYQEVRCMKLVSHPAIIRLYEVIDTQTKLYLIEELGDGGDLYDFIMKHPSGIDEELARKIFRQAVSAIQYCHQLHVVHRDLKPENLVFCKMAGDIHVKLTDFGLSRTFMPGEMIESACGSLEYSAPEILLGDSYDPPKVDVWSLGVILYMLICGRSPFASGGANETLTHIMDGRYDTPSHASDGCKDLIRKMLVVNPISRASLDEVVTHPWLKQGVEPDTQPLNILKLSDIPREEIELIIDRMEEGGYGSPEVILRTVRERPFDSVAATFYLLAEAERHRKLNLMSGGGGSRKASITHHQPVMIQSPMRSKGHAETGVLQPRRPIIRQSPQQQQQQQELDPLRRVTAGARSPYSSPPPATNGPRDSPYQDPQYISPRLGVGGEQVSTTNIRKPSFPIQSVTVAHPAEDTNQYMQPPTQSVGEDTTGSVGITLDDGPADSTPYPSILDPNLAGLRNRQLSACEEESEHDDFSGRQSPRSPRSRRLLSARSSPNLAKSISRSDFSDEENEEDNVMELTHVPPLQHLTSLSRHSPMNSPHLSARRSPTHTLVYSSDEEVHITSLYDSKRKRNSKKFRYRKKLRPLVRVDSASSDDGSISERSTRHSLPSFDFKLMNIINCRSVPSTPADDTSSDSFTSLLTARRPRSNSARAECSIHDTNDLAMQMSRQFELSDGEELEVSCENDDVMEPESSTHEHRTSGTILKASFSTPV